jgi:hypothetical protein
MLSAFALGPVTSLGSAWTHITLQHQLISFRTFLETEQELANHVGSARPQRESQVLGSPGRLFRMSRRKQRASRSMQEAAGGFQQGLRSELGWLLLHLRDSELRSDPELCFQVDYFVKRRQLQKRQDATYARDAGNMATAAASPATGIPKS